MHVILLASVKYLLTIPYARLIGLSYEQALIAVIFGGIGGFLFFYYLSGWLNRKMGTIKSFLCRMIPPFVRLRYQRFCTDPKSKRPSRIFSERSRFFVTARRKYGFWGIVITTPILLTIPLGAFLANKYYARKRHVVTYMIISIIGWAFVLTSIFHVFPR